jgi:hypothetical protein
MTLFAEGARYFRKQAQGIAEMNAKEFRWAAS